MGSASVRDARPRLGPARRLTGTVRASIASERTVRCAHRTVPPLPRPCQASVHPNARAQVARCGRAPTTLGDGVHAVRLGPSSRLTETVRTSLVRSRRPSTRLARAAPLTRSPLLALLLLLRRLLSALLEASLTSVFGCARAGWHGRRRAARSAPAPTHRYAQLAQLAFGSPSTAPPRSSSVRVRCLSRCARRPVRPFLAPNRNG